jgi:phospholipase/carboxylesterase
MNRIQAHTRSGSTMKSHVSGAVRLAAAGLDATRSARATRSAEHLLFVPLHYERNYAYPLVIWLHGPADDESQLLRVMPQVSVRNYVAAAPRGTLALRGEQTAARRFTWSEDASHVAQAEQRVADCIQEARCKCNIATKRVFIAGFDQGGTMALRLAMNRPEWFAGVLSLGGRFPTSRAPLWRLGAARRVPILLACGQQSERYSQAAVCGDLRLLHSAGMEVALRVYPAGHEITSHMLADVDRWIMQQVTGSGANRQARESNDSH